MTGLSRQAARGPAVDLLARAVALALISLLIFVGLPILAAHAG